MPINDVSGLTIAVVGHMNPSIHHPAWYQAAGLLEERDFDVGASANVICTAAVSQFATTWAQVTCQSTRWDVAVGDLAHSQRALQLMVRTFDELKHTPLTAFGYNFVTHREVGPNVARRLSNAVEQAHVGLSPRPLAKTNLSYVFPDGIKQTTISVAPSVSSDSMVYVAINFHHEIRAFVGTSQVLFDSGPIFERAFVECSADAERYVGEIVLAVSNLRTEV